MELIVPLLLWPFWTLSSRSLGHPSEDAPLYALPASHIPLCKLGWYLPRSHEVLCKKAAVTIHPGTTDFTPCGQIFFSSLEGKGEERGWGKKTEKYVKRISSTLCPQSRTSCCLKPVTGSWTLGNRNFLFPRREVRESQQEENRKWRQHTC